ncbi:MAG: BPTI/Kunitz domain-containing protein [Bacteroidales bacterium]|nr:BPTI/Kunitz domain-containing protein [Bacteroidales bacterium]
MRLPKTILFLFLALIVSKCSKDYIDNIAHCEECFLEPDPGPCYAYIPRYYFNQETGECTMFIWGGCNGVVPFETLEECLECECDSNKK